MTTFKENTKESTTVKVLQRCIPTILINSDALIKMQLFVDNCSEEVGWLGTAYKEEGKNNIYINDVFLFDQEVHSTTTEITPEGLTSFAESILSEKNGMEIWNNLKVWGHSHVNMSTSPSSQDDNQMSTFADGGHDWFIRIIANKRGELRVDLYSYTLGVIYNELKWYKTMSKEEKEIEDQIALLYDMLDEIKSQKIELYESDIKKEIEEKVKKKSYNSITYYKNGQVIDLKTNTTGTLTNETIDGDKKKDEETEKDKKSSETEEDRIETDIQVYHWFDYVDLLDIAECKNISETKELMKDYGYYNIFDDLELKIILQTAKSMSDKYYKIK